MTIPQQRESPPGVIVTLDEIYRQVKDTDKKVDNLAAAVGDMAAINRRLDQHHDRLNDHGSRIETVETWQAIAAATKHRKAPWYSIVGGIVGIVTGLIALVTLIQIANQINGG